MQNTNTCSAKHTRYQPNLKTEWRCPHCGESEEFIIEDSAVNAGIDCELLHNDDFIMCNKCGYSTSGKNYAAKMQKLANMKTCPCCGGSGFVPSTEDK